MDKFEMDKFETDSCSIKIHKNNVLGLSKT